MITETVYPPAMAVLDVCRSCAIGAKKTAKA